MSYSVLPHCNHLLKSLSSSDFQGIEPFLQFVRLNAGDVLVERDTLIKHAYFLEDGIASVNSTTPGGHVLEVSLVGREGMVVTPILLDTDKTPLRTFMQGRGSAFRMEAEVLKDAMDTQPSLRKKLLRYAHTVLLQTAQTALSIGHYTVNQRLARWILLNHDRTDGDVMAYTHDFLSRMLGVRRPGVTVALHFLESEATIISMRSHIEVRDRAKLIDMAGGSYGECEAQQYRTVAA